MYLYSFALQVEMSPLENAIEVLENKNQQLKTLITQCQTRQMQNINPLTMCLNGVIDAAVNGGVSRYQEVRILGLAILQFSDNDFLGIYNHFFKIKTSELQISVEKTKSFGK